MNHILIHSLRFRNHLEERHVREERCGASYLVDVLDELLVRVLVGVLDDDDVCKLGRFQVARFENLVLRDGEIDEVLLESQRRHAHVL